MSSEQLWYAWRKLHRSTEIALAAAVFTANRLVKTNYCRGTRRAFYECKDFWIRDHQEYLTRGRIARVETSQCYNCNGTGISTRWDYGDYDRYNDFDDYDGADDECRRCGGTGIWSERTLYLHEFLIEGMPFKFHSYMKPQQLSDEPSEDLESYGTAFTEEEEGTLPLPLSGVLRMLRYVTFAGIPEPEASTNNEEVTSDGAAFALQL